MSLGSRLAHGALRGVIAAMAMTGLREFTRRVGLLREPPPETITRRLLPGPFRRAEEGPNRTRAELLHWSYGAAGGVAFAAFPEEIRKQPFAGPAYGLGLWLGFELIIAPVLGLHQADQERRGRDRLALIADHLLYGLVLSEIRSRPRD